MKYSGSLEAKILRRECHALLDDIFGEIKSGRNNARYAWLKKNTTTGHMSQMNETELEILKYQLITLGDHNDH